MFSSISTIILFEQSIFSKICIYYQNITNYLYFFWNPIIKGYSAVAISQISIGENGIYMQHHLKGLIKLNNASVIIGIFPLIVIIIIVIIIYLIWKKILKFIFLEGWKQLFELYFLESIFLKVVYKKNFPGTWTIYKRLDISL